MEPEWCPQWAWDEAIEVAKKAIDHGWMEDWPAVKHIARALLDAHQRGRREGMEEAAKVADGYADLIPDVKLTKQTAFAVAVAARSIAGDIRAKMEEKPCEFGDGVTVRTTRS